MEVLVNGTVAGVTGRDTLSLSRCSPAPCPALTEEVRRLGQVPMLAHLGACGGGQRNSAG